MGSNKTKGDVKAENKDEGYNKPAFSDEVQQLVLNSSRYFSKLTPKKYGA